MAVTLSAQGSENFQVIFGTAMADGQLLTKPETAQEPSIAAPSLSAASGMLFLFLACVAWCVDIRN